MTYLDGANWRRHSSGSLTAIRKPDKTLFYSPIRHTITPTRFILVGCGNSKSKPTWNYGGQCRVYVAGGLSSRFQGRFLLVDEKMLLGQLRLIQLPERQAYTVQLIPARWHESFYYEIWVYAGEERIGIERDIFDIKTALLPNNAS